LSEVNTKEPGRPSILYNIATFYLALGHEEGYDVIIDQITQNYPDYFFGKTALAKRLIQQNRLEEAREVLLPLHDLTRFHGSEFMAFAGTQVLYHLAKGDIDAARAIHQTGVDVGDTQFPPFERFQEEVQRKR